MNQPIMFYRFAGKARDLPRLANTLEGALAHFGGLIYSKHGLPQPAQPKEGEQLCMSI